MLTVSELHVVPDCDNDPLPRVFEASEVREATGEYVLQADGSGEAVPEKDGTREPEESRDPDLDPVSIDEIEGEVDSDTVMLVFVDCDCCSEEVSSADSEGTVEAESEPAGETDEHRESVTELDASGDKVPLLDSIGLLVAIEESDIAFEGTGDAVPLVETLMVTDC